MSYHREAVSLTWNEVDQGFKYMILGLMRGVGGGLIAVAITVFFLQYKFTSTGLTWIPLLILVVGIVLMGAVLYAMLTVKLNTPGNPPIVLTVSGIVLLIIGFFLNMKERRKKSD
jgi:drug/metabolite transporter (DMT)-like permease